nr:PhnD/SsuA/transferrin family substrate-binding protein [Desulfomarina profundi]
MKTQFLSLCRINFLAWVTAMFLIFLPLSQKVMAADTSVRIGILAKRGKKQALKKWTPTAEYLSRTIDNFKFTVIPLDFNEIYPAVEKNQIDFILTNPAYYVQLEHNFGVERIATMKNLKFRKTTTRFGGVIFSRKDRNDITDCEDLRGKRFMAVDKHSFGGWIAAWYHFLSHGLKPSRDFSSLQFGGTHDAVVYAVRDGLVDGGTIRSDTLERMAAEGKINLKTYKILEEKSDTAHFPFLLTTALYPEWPMATLRHVDKNLAEQVTIALLQLSPQHRAASAASIGGWTIAHNYQSVHTCLKTLHIAPYEHYGIITWKASFRQHWIEFTLIGITLTGAIVAMISVLLLNRRLKTTMISLDRELENNKTMSEKLQQFKLSLDQILDCVFMFEPDTLRFIYVNRGAINQVKYTLGELLNMTPLDIKPDFSKENFRKFIAPLLRGKKIQLPSPQITRPKMDNSFLWKFFFSMFLHKTLVGDLWPLSAILHNELKKHGRRRACSPSSSMPRNWNRLDSLPQVLPMKSIHRPSSLEQTSTSWMRFLMIWQSSLNRCSNSPATAQKTSGRQLTKHLKPWTGNTWPRKSPRQSGNPGRVSNVSVPSFSP